MSSKTAADFESGFEPEYKPAEVKALPAKTCAKCGKKVFPVCKLEVDGSLYHMDCFRCATCAVHLLPASFALLDGATYCMQHAPKEARGAQRPAPGASLLRPSHLFPQAKFPVA